MAARNVACPGARRDLLPVSAATNPLADPVGRRALLPPCQLGPSRPNADFLGQDRYVSPTCLCPTMLPCWWAYSPSLQSP